jgi:hypothetical protein
VAIDEIHEYRGEKSRPFVGAVAMSMQAMAVIGASATPVLSNAKVSRCHCLPGRRVSLLTIS